MKIKNNLLTFELAREKLEIDEKGRLVWRETRRKNLIGSLAGSKDSNGYVKLSINGKSILAHRVVWFIRTGLMPEKYIDHINGNPSDNRFENLRLCEPSQNQANMKKSICNTTGFKGVQKDAGTGVKPYRARIRFQGSRYCLGRFSTAQEAKEAYDKKSKELNDEFFRSE